MIKYQEPMWGYFEFLRIEREDWFIVAEITLMQHIRICCFKKEKGNYQGDFMIASWLTGINMIFVPPLIWVLIRKIDENKIKWVLPFKETEVELSSYFLRYIDRELKGYEFNELENLKLQQQLEKGLLQLQKKLPSTKKIYI